MALLEYRVTVEIPESIEDPEATAAFIGRALVDTVQPPIALVGYSRQDVTPARGAVARADQ